MKKLLILIPLILSSCTLKERLAWVEWWKVDPEAAIDFAEELHLKQQQQQSTVWDQLAQCESGGNWATNTGNGFYGGLQFTLQSWRTVGGTGYPHQHSRETQIQMGERLQDIQGWGAWPGCSRKLGLR